MNVCEEHELYMFTALYMYTALYKCCASDKCILVCLKLRRVYKEVNIVTFMASVFKAGEPHFVFVSESGVAFRNLQNASEVTRA